MRSFYRFYLIAISILLVIHVFLSQSYSQLCYVNRGISLGLFPLATNNVVIVAGLVGLLALLSIIKVLKSKRMYARSTVLILFAAGAGLSNLVDRSVHGGVCDYLWLSFGGTQLHFNFNDVILLLNGVFVVYLLLFRHANRG